MSHFSGICPWRSQCRSITNQGYLIFGDITYDTKGKRGSHRYLLVQKMHFFYTGLVCCLLLHPIHCFFPKIFCIFYEGDLQDGDKFGFSSTRVAQTINWVYCCPDQETGEVLASDDWMKQFHLRFRYPYPGSPSGIFPQGSPITESNSRIFHEL